MRSIGWSTAVATLFRLAKDGNQGKRRPAKHAPGAGPGRVTGAGTRTASSSGSSTTPDWAGDEQSGAIRRGAGGIVGYDSSSSRRGPAVSIRRPNPRPPGSRAKSFRTLQQG